VPKASGAEWRKKSAASAAFFNDAPRIESTATNGISAGRAWQALLVVYPNMTARPGPVGPGLFIIVPRLTRRSQAWNFCDAGGWILD
jgi:hypothetical protein